MTAQRLRVQNGWARATFQYIDRIPNCGLKHGMDTHPTSVSQMCGKYDIVAGQQGSLHVGRRIIQAGSGQVTFRERSFQQVHNAEFACSESKWTLGILATMKCVAKCVKDFAFFIVQKSHIG